MVKFPTASSTILLTPTEDVVAPAIIRRGIEEQERVRRQVKAVNRLLNSIATNDMIARAASKIGLFKKLSSQMAVQFGKALRYRTL